MPTRPIQHQQNSLRPSRLAWLERRNSKIVQHCLKCFRVQHWKQIPDASTRFWMHESHDIDPLKTVIHFDDRLSSSWSVDPSNNRFQSDTMLVTGPEFNVISNCLSRFDGFWQDLFLKSSTSPGSDFSCVGRGTCKVNRMAASNS